MTAPLPYEGWRVRHWASGPAPGLAGRCLDALRAALPGAEVLVEEDADADAIAVTPPPGATAREVKFVSSLAREVIHRANLGLP